MNIRNRREKVRRTMVRVAVVAFALRCVSGCAKSGLNDHTDTDAECSGEWKWTEHPTGTTSLSGVWGRAHDDLWAFGYETFVHYNGQEWSRVTCDRCEAPFAMGGPFDGSVWGLSGRNLIRGDGVEFESALNFEEQYYIQPTDLWVGDDGVYIVGYYSIADLGFMAGLVRWDGEDLGILLGPEDYNSSSAYTSLPEGPPPYPDWKRMYAVWGDGDTVFTVGEDGTVLRFSGSTVEKLPTGTDEDLIAISGVDGNDIFAAGSEGSVLHFDGTAWLPFEVSGLSDDAVHVIHAVPSGEVFMATSGAALFERNGTDFSELLPGFSGHPRGLWWHSGDLYVAGALNGPLLEIQGHDGPPLYQAVHIGDIESLAVNSNGDLCGIEGEVIKQRIGDQWYWISNSEDDDLTDVVAGIDGAFWITASNPNSYRPALWRVSGRDIEPAPGFGRSDAHLVAAAVDRQTGEVWVSGRSGPSFDTIDDFEELTNQPGLVLVLRDGEWRDVSPSGAKGYIRDIAAVDGRVWATNSDGLLALEGDEWTTIASNDEELDHVEAVGTGEVYFGGRKGLFLWDGEELSAVPDVDDVRVFDMALDPNGLLWVSGDMGDDSNLAVLLRKGGDGWQTMIEKKDEDPMKAVVPLQAKAFAVSPDALYEGECEEQAE